MNSLFKKSNILFNYSKSKVLKGSLNNLPKFGFLLGFVFIFANMAINFITS